MLKNQKLKLKFRKKAILIIVFIVIVVAIILCLKFRKQETKEAEKVTQKTIGGITLLDTELSKYVKETESGIKINVSSELNQDKKIDNLTVKNMELTSTRGIATLLADVINDSGADTEFMNIKAVFLDEAGNILYSANGVVPTLKNGETTKLNISFSAKYITAYDVRFEN